MQSLAKQENSGLMKSEPLEVILDKLSKTPVRSVADVLASGMPTVGEITKVYGDAVSASVVAIEIESLVRFVNVGKTMNAEQQIETAKTIVFNYPFLSLPDFKLFFQRLKTGVYGKMYDRLDGQVILEALARYSDERMGVAGEMTANQHYRAKKTGGYTQPYHTSLVQAMKDAVGERKIGKVNEPTAKPFDIGQRWIRQFNNLHLRYGLNTGVLMIQIDGENFDITSFLNRKASNYEKMDKNKR